MNGLKFLSQQTLDAWAEGGQVSLDGPTLQLLDEGVSVSLIPAVHFLSLLEGEDAHKLVARVKTEAYLREIGGEVVTNSCLIGETAYEVEPGFLVEQVAA